MADTLTEGGLRDHRTVYSPETTTGTMEAGGSYEVASEQYTTFDWGPEANISGRRAIGNVDPENFDRGPEAHDLTVSFYLQGTIEASTPVYDGMMRDSDNLIPHSYTWVDREKFNSGGTRGEGYRTYTVVEGWKPGNPTLPGDPGSGEPIEVSISGNAEKVRSYQIDQPSTASDTSSLAVTGGTQVDVIIEGDQPDVNGTLKLSIPAGGGTAQGAWPGDKVDAFYLKDSIKGTVCLQDYGTTSGMGATLSIIQGSETYDNLEGDRGVPWYGTKTGAMATTAQHGNVYQSLIGDTIQWGGNDLAFGINSAELSVNQNLETTARQGKKRQRIFAGNRDIELTTTVYGNAESHDKIMSHLQKETGKVEWKMDSNTVVVNGAVLTGVGNRTIEQGQAFMELDNTFSGTGISINHSA